MPEGHTVHRLARDHQQWFAGQKIIVLSPQGRFADQADELSGRKLTDVSAHGKHLFYHWGRQRIVHVHLGLYGKFRVHKNPAGEPKGAVRLRMIGQDRTIDLNGPNRCELIDQKSYQAIIDRLGEDPLCEDASSEKVWQRIKSSRSAIGAVLLNQSIIAGIGNVFRAEILFLMGIHPDTPANQISRKQFDELWELSVRLLKIGVQHNRIITIDQNSAKRPLSKLTRDERLLIYKKTVCPICGSKVATWMLGNRKIYACTKCQRKPRQRRR